MQKHYNGDLAPCTSNELCDGLSFDWWYISSFKHVSRYVCKGCGAPGDDIPNWERKYKKNEDKDPFNCRWCASCWHFWMTQWDDEKTGSHYEDNRYSECNEECGEATWLDDGTWLCNFCIKTNCSCCDREAPTPNEMSSVKCWCCMRPRSI